MSGNAAVRRAWIAAAAASTAVGLGLASVAPRRWEIAPVHGLMLGLALCAALVRGRAIEEAASIPGARPWIQLALRGAVFLVLWWTQAFFCFEVAPEADVRRGFITLSAWVVAQALLGSGSPRREEVPVRAR